MRKNIEADNLNVAGDLTVTGSVTVQGTSDIVIGDDLTVTGDISGGTVTIGTQSLTDDSTYLVTSGNLKTTSGLLTGTTLSVGSHLYLNNSVQGQATKALTAGVATAFATVAVGVTAPNNWAAGHISYAIVASDGTDTQVQTGFLQYAFVNKAGTVTMQVRDNILGADVSSETVCTGMTAVFTAAEDTANVISIKCNATSGLTETSLAIYYWIDVMAIRTVASA